MSNLLRQEVTLLADTVVVKVGTRVLTDDAGRLSEERIASLVTDLCHVAEKRRVVLVSSGAVAAGMGRLALEKRPTDLAHLQAVAAVGQSRLVETYERSLRTHGRHAAQILLTAEDVNDRTRYLNVRNTILTLLELSALPIINENDTVSVSELLTTFGDNDHLAAIVCNLIRAPLLVVLSDVAGLYDAHPSTPGAKIISSVTRIDDVASAVQDGPSHLSKGGMASKLRAARLVTAAGGNMIIASGREPDVLARVMAAEELGTLFVAQGKTVSPWKRWIGLTVRPRGKLMLDAGARAAVENTGRSLLAIGVMAVEGEFVKGDVVAICGPDGAEFARGLSNYASDDMRRIRGLRSQQIAEALGHCPYEEVVHRDNLAVITDGRT
jgi:glutamate 5-kinase